MADVKTKFAAVTSKTFAEQAKFFMNAFWTQGIETEAENIWKCANKCVELDTDKKKDGNELDEFKAHKFLEDLGESKTVVELRATLRKIDIDLNKRMALAEYLLFKYGKTVEDLVSLPQGDPRQIEEAQVKLQAVNDALVELQKQLDQQQKDLEAQKIAEAAAKQSEAEAKRAEADAKQAEAVAKKSESEAKRAEAEAKKAEANAKQAEAVSKQAEADAKQAEAGAKQSEVALKQAEAVVKQAESELKAAVDDLNEQEQAYKNQVKNLETKANDQTATLVVRSKAANELAQLKNEDPLPLRKAKITQEAALRKVEKERKKAGEAAGKAGLEREKAEAASQKAEEDRKIAEQERERAENAARNAEEERQKAEDDARKAGDERAVAEKSAQLAEAESRKAEEATQALEEQKRRVEEAVKDTEKKAQDAMDYLQKVKTSSVPRGAVWWMERELKEAQKYLPKRKQVA